MRGAVNTLYRLSEDPEVRARMEYREKARRGHATLLRAAIEEGEARGKALGKLIYPDAQKVSPETRKPEPAYPPPAQDLKRPEPDNNVAAMFPVCSIPFYGKVAAGRPIDIDIPPGREVPVPASVLKGDKTRYFTVEVRGASMTSAGIKDGDYAVIRRAEEPPDGKIMLVRHGNESTLKRIKLEAGRMSLCWDDGSGKTIEVDSSEYEIQRELVKLMRDLD